MPLPKTQYLLATLALALIPAHAEIVYAIDSRCVLTAFDSERPAATLSLAVVRGLQPGETVLGLDFRPANKKLYALGSYSRLYVIDPMTGQASMVMPEPFTPALDGTKFGFSFNPTVDRIRITSNSGQNLRLHPDTGVIAAVDGPLQYSDGSMKPWMSAAAYTNSVPTATTTMLYGLDYIRRALVIQNPPNDGTLGVAIPLPAAIDINEISAFDISAASGKGYLAARDGGPARVQLYEVDLTSRRITLTGSLGVIDQITALSVVPEGVMTPLFERLGGMDAISAVVDQFLANVVADNRINGFFSEAVKSPARVQRLRQNLIDLVCVGSGGPCEYKGADMKTAHRGMMITDVEFDALVEDLVKALDQFKVPTTEKAALIGVLAPMRGDIVEKKQMQMLAPPASGN